MQIFMSNTGGGPIVYPTALSTVVCDNSGSSTPRAFSTITSGGYGAMVNASVAITSGTWELWASFGFNAGSGTACVLYSNTGIYAANGADSGVVPALLSTAGTVVGPATFAQVSGGSVIASAAAGGGAQVTLSCIITVTANKTIYAVPRVDFSAAGTAAAGAYIMARKIYL